jgi:surfeit locus 1 family protein
MIISPFEISSELPLLLVNRGWIKKNINSNEKPDININVMINSVKGRSGNLPKMAIRDSEAFSESIAWPMLGTYPKINEIEILLERKILPYILLLDLEEENGFQRNWEPRISSTSTNYGYAIQWFLMCFGVTVILIIKLKKLLINNK